MSDLSTFVPAYPVARGSSPPPAVDFSPAGGVCRWPGLFLAHGINPHAAPDRRSVRDSQARHLCGSTQTPHRPNSCASAMCCRISAALQRSSMARSDSAAH